MKALVTYYSQTGNTEKLARAIYAAVDIEKELFPIAEVKNTAGYDIIFVGFPTQAHSVPAKVIPFLKGLPAGQRIAFFCTHGSLKGGQLPKQGLEHAVSLTSAGKVLGAFCARGKVSSQIIDSLQDTPEHRAWADEAQGAAEHPTEADLADARVYAKEMLTKIGR
jgi:flavodoxin I